MKKIPTLFNRIYENHKIVGITPDITPGCEEAFIHGTATVKLDGSCCAVINGEFYKRYDCKKGKRPPEGAIPCCDPDPVTGHWPHWVKVDESDPADKHFRAAFITTIQEIERISGLAKIPDGTYEAIGVHFQGNPYNAPIDMIMRHGSTHVEVARDFESIKKCLEENEIEGLVFWLAGEPVCKIKRTDFGLPWPVKKGDK